MTHPICMTDGEFQFDHLPHYLSLGAGVQSSTLALMYATGELTPMPKAAIFADTQAEPVSVYEWLDWLEAQLPFPLHRVTAGSLGESELQLKVNKKTGKRYRKNLIPAFGKNDDGTKGILGRGCTRDFKIAPIRRKLRKLANIPRGCGELKIVQVIGISLDEIRRVKPSRDPWWVSRWPLIEKRISRQKCKEWMQSRGYPEPPRSACKWCPFHSNAEWRRLQVEEPKEFLEAVEFERQLQKVNEQDEVMRSVPFLHSSLKPLDQIDFRSDVERGQMLFWDDECEGMCGV